MDDSSYSVTGLIMFIHLQYLIMMEIVFIFILFFCLRKKKFEFNTHSLNDKIEHPFIFCNNLASPFCRSKPKFSMMKMCILVRILVVMFFLLYLCGLLISKKMVITFFKPNRYGEEEINDTLSFELFYWIGCSRHLVSTWT
jgi:hypothetical protein